jgi:hypothetical protein
LSAANDALGQAPGHGAPFAMTVTGDSTKLPLLRRRRRFRRRNDPAPLRHPGLDPRSMNTIRE